MNRIFQQFMAVVTICCFWSTAVVAQAKATALQTTGQVTLNGHAAPANGTVFAGDRIVTGSGTATLTTEGQSATVSSNSSAIIYDTHVELVCGSLSLMSVKGRSMVVDVTTINPTSDMARFTVSRSFDRITVRATEGEIQILSGHGAKLLQAGSSYTQTASHEGCAIPVAPYVITGGAAAVAGIGISCAVGVDWCRSNVTPFKPGP